MTTVLSARGPGCVRAAAALIAISFATSAPAVNLTTQGLPKVRIGMTVRQAEKALGARLSGGDVPASEPCWTARRSDGADASVFYMVEKGRITRIDIEQPTPGPAAKVTTARGIGLGASLDEVKRAYGPGLKLTPAGIEPGTTLVHVETSKRRGTVIELRGGKVTSFRSGLKPAIDYSEGCS